MDKRVPEVIRPMLQAYLDQLEQQLPGFVESVYLHGSIALGAFDEQRSDIDFITLIRRIETTEEAIKLYTQLINIHQTLSKDYPRWLFEGSYLQIPYPGQQKPPLL
ncbi:MAG: nucleotidyltransferase domain-containing protein, partial [Anaerolineae bacterium]|nr:nucleotidyltransferase domain-containing protein [Anaerolineae bacterium]